jgi:hypothetical protein
MRFLWVEDPKADNPKVVVYQWKRLTFGLAWSPFILRAVLTWHLKKYEAKHPGITDKTLRQIYVDGWMGEAETPEQAIEEIRLINRILGEIKMKLCKWSTNSAELTDILQREFEFSSRPSKLGINEVFEHADKKALGILWDPVTNQFMFNAEKIISEAGRLGEGLTKRQLFILALTLYDPLGFIYPAILSVKRAILSVKRVMQISWLANDK